MAEQEQDQAPEKDEPRMFTQDEVNEMMGKVRREARGKFADYDELKAKAERYDAAEEAAKTELERANERAAKAEAELKEAREREERAALLRRVSEDTGVPTGLLKGSTEEELRDSAKAVAAYAASKRPEYPADKGGAPAGGARMTKEAIESIKDPLTRLRVRAENIGLYKKE